MDPGARDSGCLPSRTPLFEVRLTVEDGSLVFDPSLESIRDNTLLVFDQTLEAMQFIESISARTASILNTAASTDYIAAVDASEPHVKKTRANIADVLERCLQGPTALRNQYRQ